MIRVQEDREIKFVTQALYQSHDLANSHEGALALGRTNDHGNT